ncbi:MAG: hypothetical protein ACRDL1_02665 [Solirubrobacterales bacterium]
MAHEGLEIGYSTDSPDWGGTFYGERVRLKGTRNLLFGDAPSALVRVPCTVAGVRVPETAGTHTYIRIDTRRSSPPFSFTNRTKLDDLLDAKGWSVWCEPKPDRTTTWNRPSSECARSSPATGSPSATGSRSRTLSPTTPARPAVVMAAPPGAEPTPPGGLPFREHAARVISEPGSGPAAP